jgi:hypothetical protein
VIGVDETLVGVFETDPERSLKAAPGVDQQPAWRGRWRHATSSGTMAFLTAGALAPSRQPATGHVVDVAFQGPAISPTVHYGPQLSGLDGCGS